MIKGTNLAEIYEAFKNHQPEKLTAEIEKTEDIKDSIRAFIDTLIQEKGNRLIIFGHAKFVFCNFHLETPFHNILVNILIMPHLGLHSK